ncbi:MAG: hypothetical protein ACE3JP_06745 [Ectobacillus sp.]
MAEPLLRSLLIIIFFISGWYCLQHKPSRLRTIGFVAIGFGVLNTVRFFFAF